MARPTELGVGSGQPASIHIGSFGWSPQHFVDFVRRVLDYVAIVSLAPVV